MDDNRSILSSVYWDTTSIRSDTTIATECFQTPSGSFMDISGCGMSKYESGSDSETISQKSEQQELQSEQQELQNEQAELKIDEKSVFDKCTVPKRSSLVPPERPPPIKLQKCCSVQLDQETTRSPEKKDWRRSFAKRMSYTKTKILKSMSMSKPPDQKTHGSSRNVFLTVRNSMRRFKSFDKNKPTVDNDGKRPQTIKGTLGSDCDYFNFEKCSIEKNSETINEVFQESNESTPIKPRRQFPQDKYLTGSKEMLQKAYNALNRKSHLQEDKSMFDLCSTLSYLFESETEGSSESTDIPGFVLDCLNAFLEINTNQIESGLQLLNRNLGQYFNLFTESLDQVEDTKRYKVEELLGSSGVCIITDCDTKQRFVVLNRNKPRNWVSFTGFLQHIEKETEYFVDQTWVCYPADSITNMYLERDCFELRLEKSKLILDTLLQLMVLLHCQLKDDSVVDIKPSNILLICSNWSLICVFDKSNLSPEKDESALTTLNIRGDESMRLTYQQSLMDLNGIVSNFLSNSENAFHLISASYPLDFLFYILLKLNKDINVLLNNL